MGLNRAYDRPFFVIGGSVRTTGGSDQLVKGQLAVVDVFASGDNGAAILSSFLGIPKDKKKLELRIGVGPRTVTRTRSNKGQSTAPFSLQEIKKLRVSAPERTVQVMDEVILGYNGFDEATAFSFKTGQSHLRLSLELRNGIIQYRGGASATELVHVNVEIPDCEVFNECVDCDACAAVDCQTITLAAIERFKTHQLAGGQTVDQFVDITPVFGNCDEPATATLIPYTYYTLELCDTGDEEALALVAGQYDVPVIRIARVGSISTYQMLLANTVGAPADNAQTIASLIKGCEVCPAGYVEVEGGFLYAITIEDDGANVTAAITANLAAAKLVAGTVLRAEGHNYGVGFYTAIYSTAITAAEIATFVSVATNGRNTATVNLVGDKNTICEDATVTDTPWTAGDSCNAIEETYSIVLPDNVCGDDRLVELQGAYAGLNIVIADSLTDSSVDVTLTGTIGTANINVAGVDYLAAFDLSLTETGADFVASHAAALLALGITVTSALGVLTFTGANALTAGITVINATTNLAGTVAAAVAIPDRRNCFTRYQVTIISNLVCEACSDVFLDYYRTTAPNSFGTFAWTKDANVGSLPTGNCLCGIKFKGKPFILSADDVLADMVAFTESGTELQISGGYPDEIREGIGTLLTGTYATTWVSRFTPRTHLYGNLRDMETEGRVYFEGGLRHENPLTRVLLGEAPAVRDNLVQSVIYYLEIAHDTYSNSFAGKHQTPISYNIVVEYGKHQAVETMLNNLAANAGVPGVQA